MVVFLVTGCIISCVRKRNPYYCPGANPNDNCAEIDAGPTRCTDSTQCTPPEVCDTQTAMCVQCTMSQASACAGVTPVCGADDSCRGCQSHSECPDSNACLPDGSCAPAADVAYVAPEPIGTDNTTCSLATPCTQIASALATERKYLKLHGTTDEAVVIKDRNIMVLADPSTTLTRTNNGNILVIDGTSNVEIYDLQINGASGNGAGISLPSGASQSLTLTRVSMSGNNGMNGAIIASGGTLSIQQSTLDGNAGGGLTASNAHVDVRQSWCINNAGGGLIASGADISIQQSTIASNGGGGISLSSSTFDLQNNFIFKNGGGATTFGGILVNQLNGATHKLEFNTIAQNVSTTGFTAGVTCQLVAQSIAFENNIVFGNTGTQVSGLNCAWAYSDIGPDTVTGAGNVNIDPQYVNAAQGNYHLRASSPLINQADPGATLATDIDSNARPQGGRSDIGADEYMP
jgi:hypothetical protein